MKTKRKGMMTALLVFAVAFNLAGQKLPNLIPFKNGDSFGFCDSNKKVLVEPKYKKVFPFGEGLARVRKGDKFGFIDSTGKERIPLKSIGVDDFFMGIASVGKSEREGYGINLEGNKVDLPTNYFRLKDNHKRYQYEILPISNDLGQYGLIDNKGKVLVECKYTRISWGINGYWKAETKEGYTFLNDSGEERFPIRPGHCGPGYYDGLVRFSSADRQTSGYINTKGEEVFILTYKAGRVEQEIGMLDPIDKEGIHFSEGKLVVINGSKFGYVDTIGKEVIPIKYDRAWNFKEGFAKVKLDGKYGFINHDGQVTGEIKYDEVNHYYEGLAFVKIAGKCGYIDTTGKEVIPIQFDHWQFEKFYDFNNGYARMKSVDKFGLINNKGEVLIKPEFDEIQDVADERAIVKLDAKYGLVDIKNKIVIPLNYRHIRRMKDGTYNVIDQEGMYGLFDKNGREIFPCKFQRIEEGFFGPYLHLGALPGDYSGRYYIDRHGTEYVAD